MDKTLSQKLQEKLDLLEEKKGNDHPYLKGIGSATLLGAGVGGAMKMAGKGSGILHGAAQGFRAGSIAALLVIGATGIAQLINIARQKGAAETKASIRNAVSHAQKNDKLTNTQKVAIRNNGQTAIAKIDQVFKNQRKHESFEHGADCDCEECKKAKEQNESLGKRILERLDSLIEEGEAKKSAAGAMKSTAAGALGGAVAGHHIVKQNRRNTLKKATTQRYVARQGVKSAAAGVKDAVNKSGAAKTVFNKESRHAAQLAKKNPTGIADKLKNGIAKLNQKGRVKSAVQNLKGDPGVVKALANQAKANANFKKADQVQKAAKASLRKVGKLTGTGRGALAGAAIGAGAYGLHKLANRNK